MGSTLVTLAFSKGYKFLTSQQFNTIICECVHIVTYFRRVIGKTMSTPTAEIMTHVHIKRGAKPMHVKCQMDYKLGNSNKKTAQTEVTVKTYCKYQLSYTV